MTVTQVLTLVFIAFVVIVVVLILVGLHESDKKDALASALEALSDFEPSQQFLSPHHRSGIAYDGSRSKLCLIEKAGQEFELRVFRHRDVLASQVMLDGETINSTSRTSQIGGAVIGGLALGGIGAVIGGLSGRTTSAQRVKRVALEVTVNDEARPVFDVIFIDFGNPQAEDNPIIKRYREYARHWHALIDVLIAKADSEDEAKTPQRTSPSDQPSIPDTLASDGRLLIADELTKLASL